MTRGTAVAIPTLHGGPLLLECLESLVRQVDQDFEVIVVDNSGCGLVSKQIPGKEHWPFPLKILEMDRNVGFAKAMNLAWSQSEAPYLAALNDDAVAAPEWLAALRTAMENDAEVGMCASRVMRYGSSRLDSAGMLIGGDASSKQRGQGAIAGQYETAQEVLLPSGSAALYRREVLEQTGGFDEKFFLYCEDTDLGLRARWLGWRCLFVPGAIVQHHYSKSAGEASPQKAFYVERNRLRTALKNLPFPHLLAMPFYTAARYFWHGVSMREGQGAAAQFRAGGNGILSLAGIVLRAHWSVFAEARSLWRQRRAIRKSARISATEFSRLLRQHFISARKIAQL